MLGVRGRPYCAQMASRTDELDDFLPCWPHSGSAARFVRQLKYRRCTAAITVIADHMAALAPVVDVVTWSPCAPRNRKSRGFDPSELLARAVAQRLRVPAVGLLSRRDSTPQTSRNREGRLRGPRLRARRRTELRGASVLLIDDVATTGATLATGAATLRAAGARQVVGLVATYVPDRGVPAAR